MTNFIVILVINFINSSVGDILDFTVLTPH